MSYSPCFDACKSINPSNPEKVAETLPEIFKMLQAVSDYSQLSASEFNAKWPQYATSSMPLMWINFSIDAKHALEKATGTQPF